MIVDAFEGVLTFVIGTTGGWPRLLGGPPGGAPPLYAGGPTP